LLNQDAVIFLRWSIRALYFPAILAQS
jgi:hypothetical protein